MDGDKVYEDCKEVARLLFPHLFSAFFVLTTWLQPVSAIFCHFALPLPLILLHFSSAGSLWLCQQIGMGVSGAVAFVVVVVIVLCWTLVCCYTLLALPI